MDEIKNTAEDPLHIEISVPNDLTDIQIEMLEAMAEPYGGVVITDEKITFPNLPQRASSTGANDDTTSDTNDTEATDAADLAFMAVRMVNEAKGEVQPVPFPDKAAVEELRSRYPKNSRIVLDFMIDEQAPAPGTQGTCRGVDDAGNVLCSWDESGSLSVAYGADICHCVSTEREAEVSLDYFGKTWCWGRRCPRCGEMSEEPLYALSRRAKINICKACGMQEALESVKANADIGTVYDSIPGVKGRLEWAIMDTAWEK